jgi:hypothetical protein
VGEKRKMRAERERGGKRRTKVVVKGTMREQGSEKEKL